MTYIKSSHLLKIALNTPLVRRIGYSSRENLIHELTLIENGLTDLLKCPS